MSYTPRPIIYLRAASGGRDAVQAQERRLRAMLDEADVAHGDFHVYSDVNTPGCCVGVSLSWLLMEARCGKVGVVIVETLPRLGRDFEIVLYALRTLNAGGADVVVAGDLVANGFLAEHLGAPRAQLLQKNRGRGRGATHSEARQ